jgi:hypothetical protein
MTHYNIHKKPPVVLAVDETSGASKAKNNTISTNK